jgi:hypothetical protein
MTTTDAAATTRRSGVRGLAIALVVLLVAALALRWWLVAVLASVEVAPESGGLNGMADGIEAAKSALLTTVFVNGAEAVVGLVALVVATVWTIRARAGAEAVAPGSQRLSTGWAVAGTLLPPVGLLVLPVVHTDLWTASTPGRRRFAPLVWTWWAAWIVATTVYVVGAVIPPFELEGGMLDFGTGVRVGVLLALAQTVWFAALAAFVLIVSRRPVRRSVAA